MKTGTVIDNINRADLLAEMRKIKQSYKEMGVFCYELYTLMYVIALKENIPYGMDIHSELNNT
jgi:hypothetical protein